MLKETFSSLKECAVNMTRNVGEAWGLSLHIEYADDLHPIDPTIGTAADTLEKLAKQHKAAEKNLLVIRENKRLPKDPGDCRNDLRKKF